MRRNRSSARTVCKALWLVPLLAIFYVTTAVAPAVQAPSLNPSLPSTGPVFRIW